MQQRPLHWEEMHVRIKLRWELPQAVEVIRGVCPLNLSLCPGGSISIVMTTSKYGTTYEGYNYMNQLSSNKQTTVQ